MNDLVYVSLNLTVPSDLLITLAHAHTEPLSCVNYLATAWQCSGTDTHTKTMNL